jgi:hypothetical protein
VKKDGPAAAARFFRSRRPWPSASAGISSSPGSFGVWNEAADLVDKPLPLSGDVYLSTVQCGLSEKRAEAPGPDSRLSAEEQIT